MKHSVTAGTNFWFIMLPASLYNKLCRQYGGHGLIHVYMLRVMSFQCAVLRTAVTNRGLPWPLWHGISSKLGLSAIIPPIAAGYSILSKFHFLCACVLPLLSSSVLLLSSPLINMRHTLHMCGVVHYWGHGVFCLCWCNDVCSSGASPNLPRDSCLFAVLVKISQCALIHIQTFSPQWMESSIFFFFPVRTYVVLRHIKQLLESSKVRLT